MGFKGYINSDTGIVHNMSWGVEMLDVPGYDKDLYMPDEMKDENGKTYAYRDANGNYYELNFGLNYHCAEK